MELDHDTRNLMRDINNLIGDEPGWREVTDEIQLPDWYSRALSAVALLARTTPTLAIGHYGEGRGMVSLFTDRTLVTIKVEQAEGGEPVVTTTARTRTALASIDLDVATPSLHSGFPSDWPGKVAARLAYRDGLVVDFQRPSPHERHTRFLTQLPGLLEDLHHD